MSQENVEIVRRVFDAVASGDSEAVFDCYDSEVEWNSSRHPLTLLVGTGRVYRGHEGLRTFFRERSEALDDLKDEIDDLIDAGEHVISLGSVHGRGRTSGIEVSMTDIAGVWTISEGKIVRVVWFETRDEAFRFARLREYVNIEKVRRIYEGWASGDFGAGANDLDPQVAWVVRPSFPESAAVIGLDALNQYMRRFLEQFEHTMIEATGLRAEGDTVLADVAQHARFRASGVEGDNRWFMLFTFRAGKIVRMECVLDEAEALEAAGLSE